MINPRMGSMVFGRVVLVHRLVVHHHLDHDDALAAVLAVERGDDNPHADLVTAEIQAIATALIEPISRGLREAFEQLRTALRAASEQVGRAAAATREQYSLAPPPHMDGASIHVRIDDEWVPVPGVTAASLSADPELPQTRSTPEPSAARRPRRVDRDRPAWQSPYGPPTRHHR